MGLAVAACATGAAAHEFWVEPSSFRVAAGAALEVRLFVGDGFPGEAYARNPEHAQRFEAIGAGGVREVPGAPGADPAGTLIVSTPGTHVLVYRSRASFIELDPEKFARYLQEEGLDEPRRLRERRGQARLPGRELYSRCAKALVAVGDPAPGGHDRAVGLELELVALDDPFRLRPGEALRVEARLGGAALPGILLRSFRRGTAGSLQQVRTDPAGRAEIRLDAPGTWMVSGVHMTEHRGPDADWESLWTSLTFAIDAAPAAAMAGGPPGLNRARE